MKFPGFVVFGILIAPAFCSAQFLFKDVTVPSHISMRSTGSYDAGPGVVVFDLNGDGWDDIYMTGGFDSDKLYLNMQDGTFKNIICPGMSTHKDLSGVSWRVFPRGGIAFDYDNDGLPDIYSCSLNNDILWHNNGDGTFTNVSDKVHLRTSLDENQSMSASFGDVRGAGVNDFYVARWIEESELRLDTNGGIGYAYKGFPNWYYVNNGDGTFAESAKEFGIDGDTGLSNIALFFDYDRDGDLDLLIGNDNGENLLPNLVFKNMLMETGTATFVDVTKEIGMQDHLSCMGIGPCDYNHDGNFDFYETSIGPDSLMKNNGNGTFSNVSSTVLPKGDGFEHNGNGFWTTTWTALMGDYDNDGWEDGFIVHGTLGSFIGVSAGKANPHKYDTSQFLSNSGGYFTNITDQAMSGAYINIQARGAAYLDVNHSGKLDICVGSLGFDPNVVTQDYRLLQNITQNSNHWIEMRFTARRTAKEAIGTTIDVWAGGVLHSRQVSTGGGFGSQNSLMQHVGLGKYDHADSIFVYWICDKNRHRQIDKYYNVAADNLYYIMENMSEAPDTTLLSLKPLKPEAIRSASQQQIPALYPNPASRNLHIQNLESEGIKHFEIYDLLGIKQLDLRGTETNFTFSISDLKPGCYVLRITTDTNTITQRFIKQ